jgi:hypothetical protein
MISRRWEGRETPEVLIRVLGGGGILDGEKDTDEVGDARAIDDPRSLE